MAAMRQLHRSLESAQTGHLLAYVAIADILLVVVGVPFELSCLHQVSAGDQNVTFLLAVLVANTSILAYMYTAAAVTGELFRRGVTLSGAVLERLRGGRPR